MSFRAVVPPDQALAAHLLEIEKVAAQTCRKRGLGPREAEELISMVKSRVMENDYAILRKFQGRSSLKTYLIVVIQWLFLDHLKHRAGGAVIPDPRGSAEKRAEERDIRLQRGVRLEEIRGLLGGLKGL